MFLKCESPARRFFTDLIVETTINHMAFHPVLPVPAIGSNRRFTSYHRCRRKPIVSCSAVGDLSVAFVLSHFEAADLLKLRKAADPERSRLVEGNFSVDLGRRRLDSLLVGPDGISLAENAKLGEERVLATWAHLKKMSKKGKSGAFEVFADGYSVPEKISGLSPTTNMPASLHPVLPEKPPTLILGGFGMHRLKDTDPAADTNAKIAAVGMQYLQGNILDICTGLGYTAIQAASSEFVSSVVTIELDPIVVDVQERNPWSRELFSNDKIIRHVGNAVEVVKQFEDDSFDAIIHDPPARAIGGDLYGAEFYKELGRVCRHRGRLFHYIGDPRSVESGRLYRGITDRLTDAGFERIEKNTLAYGLTALRG